MFHNYLALWAGFTLTISAAQTARPSPLPKTDLAVLGPVYQVAANTSFKAFDDAKVAALNAINAAIATGNTSVGTLDNQNTSFSVAVFSTKSDETLFDFHFAAPGLNGSLTKGKLTDDTIYRTGSLGKLMTIYTFLVDIGDSIYTDPVTKYIPELAAAAQTYKNPVLSANWSEVTIGALASQISGIGRDFHVGDLALTSYQQPPVSEVVANGYPPLDNSSVLQCNFYGPQPSCTRTQFLEAFIDHPPIYPPYTTPVYSNVAYIILGLVYENITGRSIDDGQRDVLTNRLGMSSTSPRPPARSADIDALIPRGDDFAIFYYDLGLASPCGGQYVSTRDLITWGKAILTNALMPSYITRRWLKPTTFTSQWERAVGAPWEIYRLQIETNDIINASRIVDSYTKSGDVGAYSTYFGLVPDYDMGISVMGAGDDPLISVSTVRATLVEIFYNAAEAAAKEQASIEFPGTFKSAQGNSSMVLEVDGGPGVAVTQWISNGIDFLTNEFLSSYKDFRLYPSALHYKDTDGLTYYTYNLELLINPGGEPTHPGNADPWFIYSDYWVQIDGFIYNNLATDMFVIGFDSDGIVQSVRCDALRTTMVRAS